MKNYLLNAMCQKCRNVLLGKTIHHDKSNAVTRVGPRLSDPWGSLSPNFGAGAGDGEWKLTEFGDFRGKNP